MSIESLFDHRCDIYHGESEEKSPGFNLPSSPAPYKYPATPAESGVECHFSVRDNNSTSMEQKAPQNEFSARVKLNLPVGTDIKLHDKVVDNDTELEYTAVTPPRNIRGHHIIVYIERIGAQKAI